MSTRRLLAVVFQCAALFACAGAAQAADPLGRISATFSPASVLHAASVDILGVTVSDVSATPVLDRRVLSLRQVAARAFGGTASGSLRIDLDGGVYSGELTVVGVDLLRVLRAQGAAVDGVSGQVSATMSFSIDAANPTSMTGKGQLRIDQAQLVRLPALLAFLYTRLRTTDNTDSFRTDFTISDGQIRFDNALIQFARDSEVRLRGTIGLDGQLDIAVNPRLRDGLLTYIPLLGDATVWISTKFARYSIRGHISNPEMRLNPFASD